MTERLKHKKTDRNKETQKHKMKYLVHKFCKHVPLYLHFSVLRLIPKKVVTLNNPSLGPQSISGYTVGGEGGGNTL